MRPPRLSIGLASLLVAVLIVVAVGIGSAIAVIPNNGTYYACLVKKTGAVKVINYPKVQCPTGTKLIKWNAKGPAGPAGPQGAQGVQGPQGVQGVQGPAGEAGITNITLTKVTAEFKVGGSSERGQATATCPAGKVVGGGFSQVFWDVDIRTSAPEGTSGWRVAATWAGPSELTVTVYAICMTTDPAGVITTAKVKVATKKRR